MLSVMLPAMRVGLFYEEHYLEIKVLPDPSKVGSRFAGRARGEQRKEKRNRMWEKERLGRLLRAGACNREHLTGPLPQPWSASDFPHPCMLYNSENYA